jgi:hypothetical protein
MQLILAGLRVHVVFAIIQRVLTLRRSSMKPELYIGLRVARCARRGWLGAFDGQLSAVSHIQLNLLSKEFTSQACVHLNWLILCLLHIAACTLYSKDQWLRCAPFPFRAMRVRTEEQWAAEETRKHCLQQSSETGSSAVQGMMWLASTPL